MLALLDLKDLAALACSCPQLRDLAYLEASDEAWIGAATAFLPPPSHPQLTGTQQSCNLSAAAVLGSG